MLRRTSDSIRAMDQLFGCVSEHVPVCFLTDSLFVYQIALHYSTPPFSYLQRIELSSHLNSIRKRGLDGFTVMEVVRVIARRTAN